MLTLKTYYEINNGILTRSKIMDYRICPNYFNRKDIKGEIEKIDKDSFKVGGAVDNLLAQMENLPKYAIFEGDARTKAGKQEKQALFDSGAIILSKAQYDAVVAISGVVEVTSAYQLIKKWEKQKVLELKMDLGQYFHTLAGLPDFFNKEDRNIDIVDLKTSRTVDITKYHYHCVEYGYYVQAALYIYLSSQLFPDVKEFHFYHLVVENKEPYRVRLFEISPIRIKQETDKLLETINQIKNDNKFKKVDANFNSCPIIGNPDFENSVGIKIGSIAEEDEDI